MRRRLKMAVALLSLACAGVAHAQWLGEVSLEARHFKDDPLDPTQHGDNLSLSGELEYHVDWDGRRQSFTLRPFARIDQHDSARTHVDMREAVWIFHDDGFEVRLGIDKVFWGVTEVYHLVDIINQTDALENPDGEQKLGQAMFKVSFERDWGTVDMFYMPWFRERRYPSGDGRPRTQPRVADELAEFESHREEYHPDVALRWAKNLGDWDIGLARFYGTGREPSLRPGVDARGRPVLIPRYEIIHQTSLDLQGAVGNWLWKLEALRRSGQGESYLATTGGFEYTFYGVFNGSSDVGGLVEVMWDERGSDATTPFNRDLFLGMRWVANDVDGSEVLAGIVSDWNTGSRFVNLEASRRFGNDWKLGLQARLWQDIAREDPLFSQRFDDYVELKLTHYF